MKYSKKRCPSVLVNCSENSSLGLSSGRNKTMQNVNHQKFKIGLAGLHKGWLQNCCFNSLNYFNFLRQVLLQLRITPNSLDDLKFLILFFFCRPSNQNYRQTFSESTGNFESTIKGISLSEITNNRRLISVLLQFVFYCQQQESRDLSSNTTLIIIFLAFHSSFQDNCHLPISQPRQHKVSILFIQKLL